MKEKLLFLGLLILSVLYWIEVFSTHISTYEWYQYLGLAITIITVLPWLIGMLISERKKSKAKAEKAAAKAAAKEAKKTK